MSFFQRHWSWFALLLICVGFVLYEIPFMQLPSYWDESFPYAYAVRHMVDHGPTLNPGQLPDKLFTGHPPLFYYLQACWEILVGTDCFPSRILPMLLSLGGIVLTFWVGRKHFGAHVGIMAALLLATRSPFLAQASRILPETMVIFFMLLALELWLSRRFIWYVIPATAMLLTKEPALTFIPLLGLWGILREWEPGKGLRGFRFRPQFRSAFFTSLPVLLAASFFVAQYFAKGWFFFPRHMQMSLPFGEVAYRIMARLQEYFVQFGTFLLTVFAVMALGFVAIQRQWPKRDTFIAWAMIVLLIFGNICFSSLNFYATSRYVLFITPFIALLGASLISQAYPTRRWVGLVLALIISAGQMVGNFTQTNFGDSNRGFMCRAQAMQKAVKWMHEQQLEDKHIAAQWLSYYALFDDAAGYVTHEGRAKNLTFDVTPQTELYFHWELDGGLLRSLDTIPHKMTAWFQEKDGWVAVYEIRPDEAPVDSTALVAPTVSLAMPADSAAAPH